MLFQVLPNIFELDSIPGASILDVQVDSPTSRRVTFNTESAALAALDKCRPKTLENKPLSPSFYATKLADYLFALFFWFLFIVLHFNSLERAYFPLMSTLLLRSPL